MRWVKRCEVNCDITTSPLEGRRRLWTDASHTGNKQINKIKHNESQKDRLSLWKCNASGCLCSSHRQWTQHKNLKEWKFVSSTCLFTVHQDAAGIKYFYFEDQKGSLCLCLFLLPWLLKPQLLGSKWAGTLVHRWQKTDKSRKQSGYLIFLSIDFIIIYIILLLPIFSYFIIFAAVMDCAEMSR